MSATIDPAAIETRFDRVEQAVSEERRRVADELEALEGFAQRVRAIETEQARTVSGAPAVAVSTGETDGALKAVRRAYEATFMAVPHFEEDYGEPYARSLVAEFGPNVAAALVSGEGFTRACKRTLLGTVSEAVTSRERFGDALEDEQESVAEAKSALVALATELAEIRRSTRTSAPMGVLDAHDARLGVLEGKCNRLLDERQSAVVAQRRTLTLPIDELDVPSYVYHDVETEARYPVLGTLADCTEVLETLRDDVQSALEGNSQAHAGTH